MVDFGSAIKKPFSDKTTLIIGLIIGAIPIVNLLIGGYALKVAEDQIKGNAAIRKWAVGDIVDYIVKIIMSVIISIVYLIIPIIIIAVGLGTAIATLLPTIMGGATPDPALLMTALGAGGAIVLVGVILAVLAVLALPMAMMKWLKAGSIGAAFKLSDVVKNCLTGDYVVTWIVVIVYAIILGLILGAIAVALGMIPFVGVVLAALVTGLLSFALSVTQYSMFAQTVK